MNEILVTKPWSDDEIILRMRMIERMQNHHMTTDIQMMQLQRELVTWEELLTRRKTGVRL